MKHFTGEGVVVNYLPSEKHEFSQPGGVKVIKTPVRKNQTVEVEEEEEIEEVIRRKVKKKKNETIVSASLCAFIFSAMQFR